MGTEVEMDRKKREMTKAAGTKEIIESRKQNYW